MNRCGLLIANSEFPSAPCLAALVTPENDVSNLEDALRDKAKGNFELETLRNAASTDIRLKIDSTIRRAAQSDGLALIYYSGHGILDLEGHLYLAAADSREDTYVLSVGMREIVTSVRQHKPRRVIIVLDCCYSGAAGGEYETKGSTAPNLVEDLKGTGVVIMTATSAIEKALGDRRSGFSVFTKYLVEGINTAIGKPVPRGKDPDVCVPVYVHELFGFVRKQMAAEPVPQTPHIWNIESTGDVLFAEVRLRGTKDRPVVGMRARWGVLREEKRAIFDLIGPSYVLDRAYHFMDWNTSFELLVAKPLGLQRGTHVITFLNKLANWTDVFDRSNKVFLPGQDPVIDVEPLQYQTSTYGMITFHKVASQIPNTRGPSKAWSVQLNISNIEKNSERFWDDMANDLRRHAVWSRYAESYDKVISPFTEYKKLLELLVSYVGNAARCADLGAGTGNVTVRLLSDHNSRTVFAVEKNEAMLECLQRKLEDRVDLRRRAVLYKGDITTALREQESDSLDACIMLNVLFALQNPQEVMSEAYRVLRRHGVVVLSTSHDGTNIRSLFNAVKNDLTEKGMFSRDLEPIWLQAFYRNLEMEDMICRDSKEDVRNYVLRAGFAIEEYRQSEYADCVVVYKAVKR
jgi:ubiquinone/menaquinone biosynthesis C-methylase UbiE